MFVRISFLYLWLHCLVPLILPAQPQHAWYSAHDEENRYEGAYEKPDGMQAIQLVAFWGNMEKYILGRDQNLKVAYFNPESGPVHLSATERREHQRYWMEVKRAPSALGWNTFAGWPVDLWLHELQVPPENLGVLARMGGKQSLRVLPARVYTESLPDWSGIYMADLRLALSFSGGNCEVYRGLYERGEPPLDQRVWTISIPPRQAGETFTLRIPNQQLSGGMEWYTVVMVFTRDAVTQEIPFRFFFHHPGG